MPLVICAIFFAVLFTGEWLWHAASVSCANDALNRYQHAEHPGHPHTDSYIDAL